MLVETAQKRHEGIFPSLLYSSGVVYAMADGNYQNYQEVQRRESEEEDAEQSGFIFVPSETISGGHRQQSATPSRAPQRQHSEKDKGIKLGLGDFVFYSFLVRLDDIDLSMFCKNDC